MPAGLCARCVHRRLIESDRGAGFIRCGLADTDPRFPRYPRLPVLACAGFVARDGDPDAGDPAGGGPLS